MSLKKSDIFDQHISCPTFSMTSPHFYHVFLFLPRQKKIFHHFSSHRQHHQSCSTCQSASSIYLHILNLQISRFEQLIATTKSCCSAIHHYLFAVAPTDCSFCHRLLNVYSELTTNLTTAYALTTETTSCCFLNQQAQQHNSFHSSCCRFLQLPMITHF